MLGNNTPSTIHVNPMFKETPKTVIHINPNVQINMAIHVNPRMVNSLNPQFMQQQRLNAFIGSKLEQRTQSIQKSVHVNPKLIQKLRNKTPNVQISGNALNCEKVKSQPQIRNCTVTKDPIRHNLSPNLVSLSRRKLVRVRPENPYKSITKICPNNSSPKFLHKVETRQIIRGRQLKKVNTSHQVKAINFSLGSQGRGISSLKKINNIASIKEVNGGKFAIKSCVASPKVSPSAYKIDRTVANKKIKTAIARKLRSANKNLINIDGVFYRSSKSQLVKSTGPSSRTPKKMSPLSKAKRLRTQSLSGKVQSKNLRKSFSSTVPQKSNYKHIISNRVKQRSLQILRHKMCKNNQPCLLFQRFGYCAKQIEGTCPKVHDKKQVALCKNFLQGKCHLDNCLLSHDVGPEKMPTCKYFLEGCCTRDSCQYLHVKVSANTPICVPFLRGYCAKGDQCKERHATICPEFDKYKRCAKGKNCPYPHKSVSYQQNTLRLPIRPNDKKQKTQPKLVDISSHDDIKKRYYDDCTEDLDRKKCNIHKKIRVMKMVHTASEDSDIIVTSDNAEMKSQPINEEGRPNRAPIGPLPSYIPIN